VITATREQARIRDLRKKLLFRVTQHHRSNPSLTGSARRARRSSFKVTEKKNLRTLIMSTFRLDLHGRKEKGGAAEKETYGKVGVDDELQASGRSVPQPYKREFVPLSARKEKGGGTRGSSREEQKKH